MVAAIRQYLKANPRYRDQTRERQQELANYLGIHHGLVTGGNGQSAPSWLTDDDVQSLRDDWTGISDLILSNKENASAFGGVNSTSPVPTKAAPAKPAPVGPAAVREAAKSTVEQDLKDKDEQMKAAMRVRDMKYGLSPKASEMWGTWGLEGQTGSGLMPAKLADEQFARDAKDPNSNLNQAMVRLRAGSLANNIYANVPANELNGRDQGTANALRLLKAGIITSDQMPEGDASRWLDKQLADPTGELYQNFNADRMQSEFDDQGYYDSRRMDRARGVDQMVSDWEAQGAAKAKAVQGLRDLGAQQLAEQKEAERVAGIIRNRTTAGVQKTMAPTMGPTVNAPMPANEMVGFGSTGLPQAEFNRHNVVGPMRRFENMLGKSANNLVRTVPSTVRGTVGGVYGSTGGTEMVGTSVPIPQRNPLNAGPYIVQQDGLGRDYRIPMMPRQRTQSPSTMVTDMDSYPTNQLGYYDRIMAEIKGRQQAQNYVTRKPTK